MVEVGDRVLVESEKVGAVTRSGVVTAVEDRLITVRWDSGSESVFVPSAGSLQVTGHKPPQGMRATPEVAGRGVDPPPRLGRLGREHQTEIWCSVDRLPTQRWPSAGAFLLGPAPDRTDRVLGARGIAPLLPGSLSGRSCRLADLLPGQTGIEVGLGRVDHEQ
jgi:hypothetical protein